MSTTGVQAPLSSKVFCTARSPHGGEAPLAFSLGFQTGARKGKERMDEVLCPMGIPSMYIDFLWSLLWLLVDHLGVLIRVEHDAGFFIKRWVGLCA
ncbi:hypothetical protein Pyn_29342 [Prunus yedoensis var. nudiflora]|uniref:Uncharacterized protein n=1 Tax=Prunus yedoensis var. nudiflora TaxID=2094558 RepID=A0A314XG40_PRUYE|nr:hypothetical protein Pyn_29342 [Prunus yedoensis var. nudiflora]